MKNLCWAVLLLLALPAFAEDTRPELQSTPLENLPRLSSIPDSINQSESMVAVECYIGNPLNGNRAGSLTANSASQAGSSCNALFFDCQGQCYGCFSDFDFSEEICVDNAGRKYLR